MDAVGVFFLRNVIPMLLILHNLFYTIESSSTTQEILNSMIRAKAVKDKVLNGYDKAVHPMIEGYNDTLVAVALIPEQIIEIDEERGLFILNSHLSLAWEDSRLKWDIATEYDGILQLPPDSLWAPKVVIQNSHNTRINPTGDASLSVLPMGFVSWIPSLHTETSCPTFGNSELVTCDVKIGSRGRDGWEVDTIREKHLFLRSFLNINPRWELLASQTKVITKKESHNGDMSIHIAFPMKRRIPPEISVVYQLCVLIMLLTLAIFWLPPDSSKKVLLGTVLFLVLTQLLMYFAWSTKYPLSQLLNKPFIQFTMYTIVITLLLQVVVIFNVCKITGPVRPPVFVMRLLKGSLGRFTCLKLSVDVNKNIPTDAIQLQEDNAKGMPYPTNPSPRDDWILIAAGLDRLCFILMSIALLITVNL